MPYTDRHKNQKRKNYMLAGILLGLIVLLFAITVMRLSLQ